MKEFIATLHNHLGDKHNVGIQVDKQADLVNVTVNVSGEKTNFTIGDWELEYIHMLNNGGYCSDDYYASCSVHDGRENHRLSITANKYPSDGLWMKCEASWHNWLGVKSSTFILSMDDPEATEFLQYIIDVFNK